MQKIESKPVYAAGLSIKPFHAVGYCYRIDGGNSKSSLPLINFIKGTISAKSQSRLKAAINWMVYLSENKKYFSKKTNMYHELKLNMITLTLSDKQKHSDTFIVTHMLQPFLKWMQRQGNQLYIWKGETQANGNIHFHITSNKYIHYKAIRDKWNSLQQLKGYLSNYISVHGNADANSTDVKGLKNVKYAALYLAKYMSKDCSDRRKIESKIWGCSQILSSLKLNFTEEMKDYREVFNVINNNSESYNFEQLKIYKYLTPSAVTPIIDYFLSSQQSEAKE